MEKSGKFLKIFHSHALFSLIALVLEFILGMYTAFYIEFPETLVDGNAWSWTMKSSPVILTHIIVGTLLVLMVLSTLGFAFASKNKNAILLAILGLVFVLAAYLGGSAFLSNVNNDLNSFIMAMGYLGAVVVYSITYYQTNPKLAA
jgi:hypothetical protein